MIEWVMLAVLLLLLGVMLVGAGSWIASLSPEEYDNLSKTKTGLRLKI